MAVQAETSTRASVPQPGIEDSDVFSMFPTLVWKLRLRGHEPINEHLLGLVRALRQGLPELAAGEAWQSGVALHRREELRGLRECVEQAAAGVLASMKIGGAALEITGCWASAYAPGAAHRQHAHPNNFLSAVYYVQVSPGANTINFHDPRSQAAVIRPPVTALTGANTDQVVVRVTDGMLLLFPSYLQHSVDANAGDNLRISVSFNLMFPSFAAAMSKPLWGEE